MATRTKNTVDINLTTAADLIGVDRAALIDALHQAKHLSHNNRLDNIASSAMIKLGYFINDLRRFNNKPTQRVYELPLVTVWGMHFLREFCKTKEVKAAKTSSKPCITQKQMSVEAQITRENLREIVANYTA